MVKAFTIIFLTLFLSSVGFAQASYSYGFKLAGGISKVPMQGEQSTFNNSFAPSGFGGLFYQTKVGKRGLFGIEAGVGQIEGRWNSTSDITDGSGNKIGTSTTTGQQHLTTIQPAIYGGFTVVNLSFYAGPQIGLFVNAVGSQETTDVISGVESQPSATEGNLNVKNLDYGAKVGLIYKVSKKISIEASYYHGLANIYNNDTFTNFKWGTQQFLVGLRIAIRNTNNCGTCPAWN